jgi:hypothetical protein
LAGAAALALLLLTVVLIVATLMGGLAPQSQCDGTSDYAPSSAALADIPGNYLRWIRDAGARYGLDWTVLAGIYSVESDFGRLDASAVRISRWRFAVADGQQGRSRRGRCTGPLGGGAGARLSWASRPGRRRSARRSR